jgi:hypothetical protein
MEYTAIAFLRDKPHVPPSMSFYPELPYRSSHQKIQR